MAITHPPVPPAIREAFVAGIGDFTSQVPGAGLDPEKLSKASNGIQVFALGLSELEASETLIDNHAVAAGWQFLLDGPAGPAMSSEVYQPGSGMPRVISFSRDKNNQEARWALAMLERLPEVHEHDYDLRILRIAGLGIDSFWLKSPAADQPDLVVPFHTLFTEVRAGVAYPMAQFLNKARPLIERTTPYA